MTRSLLTTILLGALTRAAVAQPATPDDLAKAADAAAEVAAVPSETAPAADAPKASADDIDLSALGLDPAASTFDDKLNIYGFADISYTLAHWTHDPVAFKQDTRGFSVGNFNIYFAKNLTAKARTLAEVRFTFLPNGKQNADGTLEEAVADDVTNFGRLTQWGGIVIERAYVEYDLTDHLTLRGGRWLTPYGIWNTDHGSPVIIGTSRPYIIGEQFFPEHQTGLDLAGNYFNEGFKLSYHLTASNGRGSLEAVSDQDTELGFGGRVELETPWGLRAGGSVYRGKFTGLATAPGAAAPTYEELAYGGDLQFDRGPLHFQAEVIARETHYKDGSRSAVAPGAFTPDGRDFGVYGLVGYRFDKLWNVMPFAFVEKYSPASHFLWEDVIGYDLGLNFRPSPNLVLKLQALRAVFNKDGQGLLAGQVYNNLSAQASWVF